MQTLPNKLVIREVIWEEICAHLFWRFHHVVGNGPEATTLWRLQQQKAQILENLLNSLQIRRPQAPINLMLFHRNQDLLLDELIARENELLLLYQSYPYFFTAYPHLASAFQDLITLQTNFINTLIALATPFQTDLPPLAPVLEGPVGGPDYWLDPRYRLEPVISGLTYPTSLAFDENGEMYVAESGYSYGPAYAKGRVLHMDKAGKVHEFAAGFEGPLTGMSWFRGDLYIIEGSYDGKVYKVDRNGQKQVLIHGLRGGSDHFTSEVAFGPDGKMYFAVGTVTNSGVVGVDNAYYGWLGQRPDYHDIPARDIILAGQNFPSDNPLTKMNPNAKAITGAFHPFGTPSFQGEVIRGQLLANGVVYRANPDGSGLEIIADGFRNIFGLGFSPEGKLYATNNGLDFRGSRPIEGDWDTFYEITPGWYGWPDYASGLPVTLPYFKPPGNVQPQFLLAEHPPLAEQPLIRFKPHSATQKFDFSTSDSFAPRGEVFFAQFGSASPITTGDIRPAGFRVVRANPYTGQVHDFMINLKPGKAGEGPERPVAVRFSPDGQSLYVVDFGILGADVATVIPFSETGAVWRIVRA
ncbi:PQQ-dependent sugar dehydrogenase [Paenibacillus elgii]